MKHSKDIANERPRAVKAPRGVSASRARKMPRGAEAHRAAQRRTQAHRAAALLAVLTIAAAALLFAGCTAGEPERAEAPRRVRWTEVNASPSAERRTFTGRTRSGSEARVSPRIAGTVLEVHADVGDTVRAGELIAQIDPEPVRLQRDAAATQLSAARSQLAHARATYERVQQLYEQDLASRSDFDAARTAVETAESQKAGAERRLELAELQLSYTEVRSPFHGRVSARLVDGGENVAAGHPIVMLVSQDRWEVQVSVPDSVVLDIEVGDEVTVRIPAVGEDPLGGTVTGVGAGAAQAAGTYPVTIRLGEGGERLRSGMIAQVSFPRSTRVAVPTIRLPGSGVGQDREGQYVYVLAENAEGEHAAWNGQEVARLVRREVVTGRLLQDEIEILDGLEDGERVVTLGLNHLSDGMPVRPLEPASDNGGRR